ncbi:uncharacterized protein [Haliotis cracherodii]|uniref:uncharacterized protein n=1 Tax=Haliotis cracherodii TaxID=6455 RepID=UPI0039EA5B9B
MPTLYQDLTVWVCVSLAWSVASTSVTSVGTIPAATSGTPSVLTNNSEPDTADIPAKTTGASPTTSQCVFTVDDDSADDFAYLGRSHNPRVVYMTISLLNTSFASKTKLAFRPLEWMWTFGTPSGAAAFLSWPRDYRVLSLGILDSFTDSLAVKLHVYPRNCRVHLGSKATTQAISDAIGDMIKTTLSVVNADYNHSIWCYQEIKHKLPLSDVIANSLGIKTRILVNKCCRLKFDTATRLRPAICTEPPREPTFTTTSLPSVLGVIGLFYFPIWLCAMSYNMSPKSIPSSQADMERTSTLEMDISHDVIWLYQGKRSPVTFSSIFTRMFPHLKRHPHMTSRIQRLLFIYLSPAITYVRLYAYYTSEFQYLQDSIKANVPIGYSAVFFGMELSRRNVFTALGGPYVLHCVYFVVGTLLFCLPRNLSQAMCNVLHQCPTKIWTPLWLGLVRTSRLGGLNCSSEDNSYKLVSRVLKANLFLLINIEFWSSMSKVQYTRLQNISAKLDSLPAVVKYLLMVFICTVYIVVCLVETLLCVVYYGIPIVYFFTLILRVYIKLVLETFNSVGWLNNSKSPVARGLRLLRFPASVATGVVLVYTLYTSCAIFISSFTFMFGVMTFTYIGVIAYPNIAFGYVTFAVTCLYYVWKTVRDIDIGYMNLFTKTIKVSKNLQKEHPESSKTPTRSTKIRKMVAVVENAAIPEEHVTNMGDSSVQVPYVRTCDSRPGVPKDLFETVIEKHRPFRVCVFLSLLKLTAICLLITTTVHLIHDFNTHHHISVIVSVLSSLIVCSIPRVLSLVLSHEDRAATEEDFCRRLSKTVREYWRQKDRRELVSMCSSVKQKVSE